MFSNDAGAVPERLRFASLHNACRSHMSQCVTQGSARVIQCLQEGRDQLGVYCKAALFDFEQDMAENIDFKAPLKVQMPDIPHQAALTVNM